MRPDFFADLFHLPESERTQLIAIYRRLTGDPLMLLKLQHLRDHFFERRSTLNWAPIEVLTAFLAVISETLYKAGIRSPDGGATLSVALTLSIIHLIGWPLESEDDEIDAEAFQ
jgi:hypothetical protein